MTWNPDANEMDELLGALALDAVEPDEADRLELYLRENPRARAEVEEYREVAALLAGAGAEAPPGIWDRIAEQIEQPPDGQPAPLLEFRRRGPRAARRGPRRPWPLVAAAAAVIAVAALSFEVVRQQDRLDDLELTQDALEASVDPNAQHFELRRIDDETLAMRLSVRSDREAWVVGEDLEDLPDDQEYQLWVLDGGQPISAGLLGDDPGVRRFTPQSTGRQYAVSIEPAGGSASPTTVVAASAAPE
jgi:anti-sigma-K factor RskA